MKSVWEGVLGDVLRAASGARPTPGGGSTAGIGAAFGAGLILMALRITVQKTPDRAADLGPQIAALEDVQAHMQALTDEDVRVFRAFVDAIRQPGEERAAALDEVAQAARDTPLALARACLDAMRRGAAVLDAVHAEVVSDVGAGVFLLRGALDAAALTVRINLRPLPAPDRTDWEATLSALETEAQAVSETVRAGCAARLAAPLEH